MAQFIGGGTLPCGCPIERGDGANICTHPCHNSYRIMYRLPLHQDPATKPRRK